MLTHVIGAHSERRQDLRRVLIASCQLLNLPYLLSASSRPGSPTSSKEYQNMFDSQSRRAFLKSMAVAGTALPLVSAGPLHAASANGKLNVASVGVGGKGWSDLTAITASPNVNIVAI